jgi:hypothetical protein
MRCGDVALRLSIVFSVAGFITLAAGLYEIDRREKSSAETAAANLAEIEQRVQTLANQIRILNDQYATELGKDGFRRAEGARGRFARPPLGVGSGPTSNASALWSLGAPTA